MRSVTRSVCAVLGLAGVAAFFLSCAGGGRTTAERLENGQRGYLEYCAMCHGNEGQGDGDLAATIQKEAGVTIPRLNDEARLAGLGRTGVKKVVVNGGAHTGRSNLMPSWGDRLEGTLVDDITDYVLQLPSQKPGVPAATIEKYLMAPPGSPAEGRSLYVHHCAACHGPEGRGDGTFAQVLRQKHNIRPRNLTDSTYLATKSDQDLYVTISLGGGHMGKSPYMPAWTVYLVPAQIKDLVSYIRVISGTPPRP